MKLKIEYSNGLVREYEAEDLQGTPLGLLALVHDTGVQTPEGKNLVKIVAYVNPMTMVDITPIDVPAVVVEG